MGLPADSDLLRFRQRLYQHYLTTCGRSDLEQIRDDLRHRAPYIRRLIRSWIPQDRGVAILDIGCGHGALLYFLKDAGYWNIKGVDESPQQVATAKALGLSCVQEGNVLSQLQGTDSGKWDVVIAFDIFEHFTKPELIQVTEELHRIMKHGGRLILHAPNGEGIFSGRVFFGDLTHETCFTRQSMRQLLNLCGFTLLGFDEDVPAVHGLKSFIRYALWKICRAFFHLVYIAETGDVGRDLVLTQNFLAVAQKV